MLRYPTFTVVLVMVAIGCRESGPTDAASVRHSGDLLATASSATQRPISDFVSAQGQFCLPGDAGVCLLFDPPVQNFVVWRDPSGVCLSIDYAGVAKAWLEQASGGAISLPTTIDGTISERSLDDGTTEIHVRLHTTGALTWAGECFPGGNVYFGYRAADVLAGAEPALGESVLDLVFINHAPGAPLPDLFEMMILPDATQELSSMTFRATASGVLHAAYGVAEGTPGVALVVLISRTGTSAPGAGVPIARVELRPLGH